MQGFLKYFVQKSSVNRIYRSLRAATVFALMAAFVAFSMNFPVSAQKNVTAKSGFEIEFSGSTGSSINNGKAVEKEKRLMIAKAIRSKKVLPLKSMINFVEKKTGAQILDASLITPNPFNYKSWYYVIKQRSRKGRISVKKYAAKNGQEIK